VSIYYTFIYISMKIYPPSRPVSSLLSYMYLSEFKDLEIDYKSLCICTIILYVCIYTKTYRSLAENFAWQLTSHSRRHVEGLTYITMRCRSRLPSAVFNVLFWLSSAYKGTIPIRLRKRRSCVCDLHTIKECEFRL